MKQDHPKCALESPLQKCPDVMLTTTEVSPLNKNSAGNTKRIIYLIMALRHNKETAF